MKDALRILSVHGAAWNPFIRILAKEIASDSFIVDSSISAFWDRQEKYDIIQIHWPEFLFKITCRNLPTKAFGERLSDTFQKWKRTGTKIVFTRHDEKTHYIDGEEIRKFLFEIIETEADAIVHLGYFSHNRMIASKPVKNQLHVVIPHHIYDTLYSNSLSQTAARKALNLNEKFKVILTFGTFRHEEEYMLVKNAFEKLNEPDKFLFAPDWHQFGWHERINKNIPIEGNSWLGRGIVDTNMLSYCFAAADVVFLQRLRNLNSGNLPMGFLFNKTVVGPAIGNISENLDNTEYYSQDGGNRNPFNPIPEKIIKKPMIGKECFAELVQSGSYPPMAWTYIYKREFIEHYSLRFAEGIIHEDELWTPLVISRASRMFITDLCFYYYRQRKDSIVKVTNIRKRLDSLIFIANQLVEFAGQFSFSEEEKELKNWLFVTIFRLYRNAFSLLLFIKDPTYSLPVHHLDSIWIECCKMQPEPQRRCSYLYSSSKQMLKQFTDMHASALLNLIEA